MAALEVSGRRQGESLGQPGIWSRAGDVTPSAVSKRICWSGRGRSPLHTKDAVAVSG